jgi:tRNA threonylcarbamoyladenosine modification (KEOPS) complex Cgi121 subunit
MDINSSAKTHPRFILLKNRFINLQYVKSVVIERTIHDGVAVSIYREGDEPLICVDEDAIKIIEFLTDNAELTVKGKPQSWERIARSA